MKKPQLNPGILSNDSEIAFLQWALPQMGYKWKGFKKPRGQVLKRIRGRIQELELSGGYSEYKQYLENNPGEWELLDRFCGVTVSKFFRDRKLWDFIRDNLLKEYIRTGNPDSVSIWSAGCCNGEEPYSITIIADQLSEKTDLEVKTEILATDRNEKVLSRGLNGIYPESALQELTEEEREKYFQTEKETEQYKISEKLIHHIEFEQRDIRRSFPRRQFDFVFCRSLVFTYYSLKHQQRFLSRLKSHLKKKGFLIIGGHEEIPATNWLKRISETFPVYRYY